MKDVLVEVQSSLQKIPAQNVGIEPFDMKAPRSQSMHNLLSQKLQAFSPLERQRIHSEFEGFGPLTHLMTDPTVTEVLINSPHDIWMERNGQLAQVQDQFASDLTYQNFLDRLNLLTGLQISVEKPVAEGDFQNFRVHWIGHYLTKNYDALSFRRHPENPWSFARLLAHDWSSGQGLNVLAEIIDCRKNFLVIGETSSGKTSVLNACLQSLHASERAVILEDTKELNLPNSASVRLLTRPFHSDAVTEVTLADLVRNALRLRPDRIVLGEVRGAEAKDLLLALSTGHAGSFGTLHAGDPQQALLRLEMLVQMGAPQWQASIVRKLISQSLHYIVSVGKNRYGQRKLKAIHRLTSAEETGILLETVFQEDVGTH